MDGDREDRLVRLEELAAHQGQMIEDLSRQLAEQWKIVERLKRQLDEVTDRFDELEETARAAPANQKPPHW